MLRTRSGLPKHCCWNTDRHGKRRVRFRKAGFTTYLTGIPWSEDFMRQYATALEGVQALAIDIGAERTIPGSFNALCVSYYRSPEYRALAPISQRNRRNVIERFRVEHGHKPVARLDRVHIQGFIEAKADTPEAANVLLKTLRLLLNYAIFIGMIPSNPALAVRGFRSKGDGLHTWTESEATQFEARHPIGSKARLAFALLLYSAQRKSDVARMGWQHIKSDAIEVRQQKTDAKLLIPVHPDLSRVLALAPKTNLTILTSERSAPFSSSGFSVWFRKCCDDAGLPNCTAHGLRKLAATRLANSGCTPAQIMAITGHRSMSELLRYTRAADQERLAKEALSKQLRAETGTEIVQPATPVGQKGQK
jgi:integrase